MIDIIVSREGVEDDEPPSSGWIEKVVMETLRAARFEDNAEVSVLLTGDERIHQLNQEYRGKDKPTDVLSFAFEDDQSVKLPPEVPRMLGDVVLSLETIARQAEQNKVTVPRETAWALGHGVLHLLGYDHQTDEEEEEMRALENEMLQTLGEEAMGW